MTYTSKYETGDSVIVLYQRTNEKTWTFVTGYIGCVIFGNADVRYSIQDKYSGSTFPEKNIFGKDDIENLTQRMIEILKEGK